MARLIRSTLVVALLAGCNCGGMPAGSSSSGASSATSTASGSTSATSSASSSGSAGTSGGSGSSGTGSASISSTTGSASGSSTTGTSASTGSGSSTGGGQTLVQTTLTCVDDGSPGKSWSTQVNVSSVNICEAFPSTNELIVDIRGAQDFQHLHVHLEGFTGVGSYTTQGAVEDAGNYVAVRGPANPDGVCCTDVDSAAGAGCAAPTCTVNVTNADVWSTPTGGTGRVALTVTCPYLVGGGVGCVTCNLGPSSITLDIPDCSSS